MKLWGMNAGYEIYINNYEARLNSYLKTGMNCSKIMLIIDSIVSSHCYRCQNHILNCDILSNSLFEPSNRMYIF